MTTPMVLDEAALYGLSDVDCEFCLATHKPGPCARPHVQVPNAPAPKSLEQAAQEHATDQNYTAAISHAEQLAQQLGANMSHARVQAAIRDYAHAHAQHQQAVATADKARAMAQKAHDTAVAKNQAIDKANAAAQAAFQAQQVAAQHRAALAAAAKAHGKGKPGQKPAPGPHPVFPPAPPAHHSLDTDLYGQLHVETLYGSDRASTPGREGSTGPFPAQYGRPHVYARDVHSGAGNCVCGRGLHDVMHVQAAPGVPIPREHALYGLPEVDELYAIVSSAHWWCSIGEFCRNPLHPGPCKGWKHMLHQVAPGAYHAYEKQRVAKLNEKRKAKIAELEAAGKRVPAYLKKEITYQQVPVKPEGVNFEAPTPKEAISKLPATAKEIGAKIAMKHEAIAKAKAEKQAAALVNIIAAHSPLSKAQHAVMNKKVADAIASLKPGEKPSDVPLVANTLKLAADKLAAGAKLDGPQHTELLNAMKEHVDQGIPELPLLHVSATNQAKAIQKAAADAAIAKQKAADLEAANKLAAEKAITKEKLKALLTAHEHIDWTKVPQSDRVAAIASLKQSVSSGHLDVAERLKANAMIAKISASMTAVDAYTSTQKAIASLLDNAHYSPEANPSHFLASLDHLKLGDVQGLSEEHKAKLRDALDNISKNYEGQPAGSLAAAIRSGWSPALGAAPVKPAKGTSPHLGAVPDLPTGTKSTTSKASGKFEIVKDRGKNGDGWFVGPDGKTTGLWGKYGASGLMIRHVDKDGTERFLLVKRGSGYDQAGQWQLPGGALDQLENAHQGAARETHEELGATPEYLAGLKSHGEHVSEAPGGWKYTSIAATASDQFTPKVDGTETADAKWMTRAEIDALDKQGQLIKPLSGGKIHQNVTSLFPVIGTAKSAESAAKVTGPLAHPDMMHAVDVAKTSSPTELVKAMNAPGVNATQWKKLPAKTGADVMMKLAQAHATDPKGAEAAAENVGVPAELVQGLAQNLHQAAAKHGGSPAAVPTHVKHAESLASGATYGTAKAKLAAYEKLSQAEYHALPGHVQAAIHADLLEAHDKFLDPKKKAQVGAVMDKLGPVKAPAGAGAPHHEPAAPVVGKPTASVNHAQKHAKGFKGASLYAGQPLSNTDALLAGKHVQDQVDAGVNVQDATYAATVDLANQWAAKHLTSLPLSVSEKAKIKLKAHDELAKMVEDGRGLHEATAGGVLDTALNPDPFWTPDEHTLHLKQAAGLSVPVVNPPQAGAGGPAKAVGKAVPKTKKPPASKHIAPNAAKYHAAWKAASVAAGGQGLSLNPADFQKAIDSGTQGELIGSASKKIAAYWKSLHGTIDEPKLAEEIKEQILSGQTVAPSGSILAKTGHGPGVSGHASVSGMAEGKFPAGQTVAGIEHGKSTTVKPHPHQPSMKQVVATGQTAKVNAYNKKLADATEGNSALHSAPLSISKMSSMYDQKFGSTPASTAKNAFYAYSGSTHHTINDELRQQAKGNGELSSSVKGYTKAMDAAFPHSKLPQDTIVFRGIGAGNAAFGDGWSKDSSMVGVVALDPGFASSSINYHTAKAFAGLGSNAVVMRVLVPKGHPAVSLVGGQHSHESELLLPRGVRFRVVADNGWQDGVRQLDVEIVK